MGLDYPTLRAAKPMAQASSSSLLQQLHCIGQRADGLFARHAGIPVTPRLLVILEAVAGANGLSQTGIMAVTGINRSSTAVLVKRLVILGWVHRRRTRRDTRAYAVRLTQKGWRILALAAPAVREAEEALLSSLSGPQRTDFLRALSLIATEQSGSHRVGKWDGGDTL